MSQKIDFTTLKSWIPDYTNGETVSHWDSSVKTWTADKKGFVAFQVWGYVTRTTARTSVLVRVQVNNRTVGYATSQATDPNNNITASAGGIIPVDVGDIITYSITSGPSYTADGTYVNFAGLYFIPGRWV